MRTKNRRISLQTSPQISKKLIDIANNELSKFQESLMLVKVLKASEIQIFSKRENQFQSLQQKVAKHNKFLASIESNVKAKAQSQFLLQNSQYVLSSAKVLQELDVNRRDKLHFYREQNSQLTARIQSLQQTISSMTQNWKQPTLNNKYLCHLKNRVQKRKKQQQRLQLKITNTTERQHQEMLNICQKIDGMLDKHSAIRIDRQHS